MEGFVIVKGFERYLVNKYGLIYDTKKGRFLTQCITQGYLYVALINDKKVKHFYVHRIVGRAFVDNLKNNPQINHINTIKIDCFYKNLEWTTQKENVRHAWDNGLCKTNFKVNNKKCCVNNIDFNSLREASIFFNIHYTTLSAIGRKRIKSNKYTVELI